ncbi:hypothetical protein [Nitratiruptor tergarcus]|uniref:Uncharacterized protein n=1 Tax=Nitratiruptor tergarcus DSM 16512 TaxID=1069081 RepID=A0A1W1WUR3_9BACT|nr:hypothetical protein [Nitratiruptor tergarcus]SMC10061.1 hypothetical protein SAMN05660197_1896 [Nitratiruptor tergarcus DSM 16512]
MDKDKLITKIIFGEEKISKVKFPADEEAKKSFEIAWDIWENFENNIRKPIRALVTHKICKILKEKIEKEEKYKSFDFIDSGFCKGVHWEAFLFFPKNWQINKNERPILSYALEFDKNNYIGMYYGICKKDEYTPYVGKTPENIEELKKLQEKFRKQGFSLTTKWWPFYKFFTEPYGSMNQKEFYNKVFEKGIDQVASYYVNELESLIEQTQDDIDKFIEKYKKEKGLI